MKIVNLLMKKFDALVNRIVFYRHGIAYSKESISISGRPLICGEGTIRFGENVVINSGIRFNSIGGQSRTILFSDKNSTISIGSNVGISNSALVAKGSGIEIADDVMIGASCKIYDTDFHSVNYSERMQRPDLGIKTGKVTICAGAFIGAHSIILKGVTIGAKSVIGAGSVVTKNIPDGEVWAGNPARFLRRLVEYDEIAEEGE